MTQTDERALEPFERVHDIPRTVRALRLAVRDALIEHKRDGDPVVVWEDGQVRWIVAEDIVIPDMEGIEDIP